MSKIKNVDSILRELEKKYNPMYKPETIYVNVSSSFLARARCTWCKGKPNHYSYIRLPEKWYDPKNQRENFAINLKWLGRMNEDWYLDLSPRYFHSAHDFSHKLENKGYNPILHRARGVRASSEGNITEVVWCICGSTMWAFNQKSAKHRPEITNRKGRYNYPNKFEF